MVKKIKYIYIFLLSISSIFISENLFAAEIKVKTAGDIFLNLSDVFSPFIGIIFGLATIAGLAFTISAVFKFKQFKDNPQQISIGQPIGLFFLGAFMLWLPFMIKSIGHTVTGIQSDTKLR